MSNRSGETSRDITEVSTTFVADSVTVASASCPEPAVIWQPDGHQVSMVDDRDCRSLTCAAIFRGRFDKEAVQEAFDALLRRHSLLRSYYARDRAGRLLVVTPAGVIAPVSVVDLRSLHAPECREAILRIADSLAGAAYDLNRGPLVACTVARLSDDITLFLVGAHRSLVDAASLNIIRHDLVVLYRAALLHCPPALEPITVEYRDFVRERTRWLSSEQATPDLDYWRRILARSRSLFRLPYDRKVPPMPNAVRSDVTGAISSEVLQRLRVIAAAERTTLAVVFSALLAIMLADWSGSADVAAWVCHLGRPRKEHFKVVGCFIDHWLLRLEVAPEAAFIDVLRQVRQLTLEAMPHLRVGVHRLVPELQQLNAGELHPAIVVNFMPYTKASGITMSEDLSLPQRSSTGLSKDSLIALIVNGFEFANHLGWHLVHSSHLFEESTIAGFSVALSTVAKRVALDPQQTVRDLAWARTRAGALTAA